MLEKELVFPWLYNCLYKNFHSFHKVVLLMDHCKDLCYFGSEWHIVPEIPDLLVGGDNVTILVLPHEASSASKGKNKNFLMYIFSLGLNTPYNKIWMRKFEWYRRKLCLYFLGKLAFRISNARA